MILGERDVCAGDSGGPLICAVDGQPVVVGVVSMHKDFCEVAGEPPVFAEVGGQHLKWVKSWLEQ